MGSGAAVGFSGGRTSECHPSRKKRHPVTTEVISGASVQRCYLWGCVPEGGHRNAVRHEKGSREEGWLPQTGHGMPASQHIRFSSGFPLINAFRQKGRRVRVLPHSPGERAAPFWDTTPFRRITPRKRVSPQLAPKRPNREKHSQQAPFPVVGMWIALRRSAPGDSIRFDPRFPVRSVFGGGVPLSLSLPRIPGSAVSFRSPFVPGWSRGRWEKPTRPSAPVKQISHFLVDPTAFWGCVFSGSFHTC